MLCMWYAYAMTAVIMRSLVAVMLPFLRSNTTSERSGVNEQTPLLTENAPDRRTPVDAVDDHTSDVPRYHSSAYARPNEIGTEPNVILPQKDLLEDTESTAFSARRNGFTTDPVPEVAVHVAETFEYDSSPSDSASESEPELKASFMPLFVDTPGGTVSVILRALRPSASADDVGVELDGKKVDRSVEKLDEGIYSLKFSAGVNGGKVKIFVGLI